jgi:hypothetical protein
MAVNRTGVLVYGSVATLNNACRSRGLHPRLAMTRVQGKEQLFLASLEAQQAPR